MSNPSAEYPQSTRYFFPPRAAIAQDGEASNPPRKRFRLYWGQFIRHAAQKAPIDPDTAYALDLFNQIEFHVSQETWDRLEDMLSTAVSWSENPLLSKTINAMWVSEPAAIAYFDALYSPENHSSQVHPATLRMIAKYLFAVKNLPLRRAQAFAETCPRRHIGFGEKSHHALHEKASAAISDHWWAWHTGKGEDSAPESREKEEAPAPEAPVASHKKVPYTKFPLVVWNSTTQQKETRTFYLHWHRLIEEAQAKHPLDKETRDALVLFNKILFTVPKEAFEQLEALKARAKQLSETPSSVEIYGDREEEIAVGKYFYALYSSENHDSQVAPTTLRKIAKYLFAVCHFPDKALDFATALDFPLDANIYSDSVPDNLLRQIHWKASDKIRTHWLSFKCPKPLEYAQAPEAPIAPAEEPKKNPPLAVGQVWRTNGGGEATICDRFQMSFYCDGNGEHEVSTDGMSLGGIRGWNLKEYIRQTDRPRLEVGKKYRTAKGEIVTIVEDGFGDRHHQFMGDNAKRYYQFGFGVNDPIVALVEEEPKKNPPLAVGQVWKTRWGYKATLYSLDRTGLIGARLENGETVLYRASGRTVCGNDQYELVEYLNETNLLRIECGKKYRTRSGKIVTIVEDDGQRLKTDGAEYYNQFSFGSDDPLVALVEEDPVNPPLAVGQVWKTRSGEEATIYYADPDTDHYWFIVEPSTVFRECICDQNGKNRNIHRKSLDDLVEYLRETGRQKIKAGKTYRTQSGKLVTIKPEESDMSIWFCAEDGSWYRQFSFGSSDPIVALVEEEPAFPDVESIMVSAFAEFEKGKSLTEVGGLICDAVGLRELYEEQLEDPKNRAILALGEGLIRSLGTLLRPNREKPFVMTVTFSLTDVEHLLDKAPRERRS